ncbi:MAG: hypothetical protein IPI92_17525 [Gemmatimonadetes bacterium]|nr:hypothetical protein [Gemmatimonadota bacterium]
MDADNFEDVASPPPLAILTVFNLPIEITSGTEISLTARRRRARKRQRGFEAA